MSAVNVPPVVVFFVSTTGGRGRDVITSWNAPTSILASIMAPKPVSTGDPWPHHLLESGQLERDRVRANRHDRERVGPAGAVVTTTGLLKPRARHSHRHAGQSRRPT